jgi:hypothetical protein
MHNQPTIVRILAIDAPRDTIVALLSRSRNGRGQASRLTEERDGYYFAVIDHPDTASVFQTVLARLSISSQEISQDELPGAVRVQAKAGAQIAGSDGLGLGPVIDAFLASLSSPSSSLFGGGSSGKVRIFY